MRTIFKLALLGLLASSLTGCLGNFNLGEFIADSTTTSSSGTYVNPRIDAWVLEGRCPPEAGALCRGGNGNGQLTIAQRSQIAAHIKDVLVNSNDFRQIAFWLGERVYRRKKDRWHQFTLNNGRYEYQITVFYRPDREARNGDIVRYQLKVEGRDLSTGVTKTIHGEVEKDLRGGEWRVYN